MSNKKNIKILGIVFVVLLAIVFINKYVENKKGDRSFKSYIVEIDTTKIDYIQITPKMKNGEVILKKENGWKVLLEERLLSADIFTINEMMQQLVNLKPSRVAATKEEKWADFEVTDSLATRVILKSKGDVVADIYVGKFDYKQQGQGPGMNPYQQQNPQFFTYIRNANEKEVYVVKEFLSMTFNREPSAFRNKTVTNSEYANWTKLSFTYPADSSYHLMKKNGSWMIAGLMVDSIKVKTYIDNIRNKISSNFVDDIDKNQLTNPIFSLSIEGDNTAQINLNAYIADSTNQYYVTSSLNPDAVFSGAKASLAKDIFAPKSRFELEQEQIEVDVNE